MNQAVIDTAWAAPAAAAAATGIFTPPPAAGRLFLQAADAVAFDGTTLVLRGVHPLTLDLADRRHPAGEMATGTFVASWPETRNDADEDGDFRRKDFGASLSVVVGGREEAGEVALSRAESHQVASYPAAVK